MDPISAFALAQGALSAIRTGVDFYKQCKAASADVSEITMEVSGHIGKFLDAKGVVEEAAVKAKKESEDPDNKGSINSQALNNVMMQVQLFNAEKELREMLVYHCPGLGSIWSQFETERERLLSIKRAYEEAEEERQLYLKYESDRRAALRRLKLKELWIDAYWTVAALVAICSFVGCMFLIVQDRIRTNPELGTCFIPKGSPGYYTYSNLRWVNCEAVRP